MKHYLLKLAVVICTLAASLARGQSIYEPYAFTTLAGLALNSGTNDNTGSQARFNQPWGVAVDGAGNAYVADTLNQTIRKITPGGVVTTLAGVAGSAGYNDGPATTALFSRPIGVAVNSAGTVVYVADYNNHVIRQISGGTVSTLAGSPGVFGTNDATGTAAKFHNPFGVALNSAGTVIYVTDQNNQTIRSIALPGGVVTTLAGAPGLSGTTDDPVNDLNARFNTPKGIAVDSSGNVYVADTGNFTVRKIAASGGVSTLAGAPGTNGFTDGTGGSSRFSLLSGMSPFGGPCGLAVDTNGNLYVTDQGNHLIRKITPGGNVTTLGGLALTSGSTDGTGSAARFNDPAGVAVNGGTLYVADTLNHTIRTGTLATTNPCISFVAGTNKTVQCGSAWSFDPPTKIADACCASYNLTFTTGTNGTCPMVITRTWLISDACGNTNTCSQTVTVAAPLAFFQVISKDSTTAVYNSLYGHGPITLTIAAAAPSTVYYDGPYIFSQFSTLFPDANNSWGVPAQTVRIIGAGTFTISIDLTQYNAISPGLVFGFYNIRDEGTYSVTAYDAANVQISPPFTWHKIGNDDDALHLYASTHLGLDPATGIFTTQYFQAGVQSDAAFWNQIPANTARIVITGALQSGFQDGVGIYFADHDTCCITNSCITFTSSTNKTVESSSAWHFDPPTNIVDACCASYSLSFSTVTNGVCPQVLTRTWLISDLCGNSNLCTQTVTVTDTTPPSVNCSADKTVGSGSAWTFDPPTATDAGSGTNIVVFVLNTVTNAPGQSITRTWLLSDLCGNTNTCSQTVTLTNSTAACVSGATWLPRQSIHDAPAVASSADGSKLVAADSQGPIYTSTDFGVTWIPRTGTQDWVAVSSSVDGSKLAAAVHGGQIYTSVNSGTNWTAQASATTNWQSLASSADGSKLVAGVDGGLIYTSTNSGTNWTAQASGMQHWYSLASSADGVKLVAAANAGQIYTSINSGVNWTPQASGSRNWYTVASSADGTKLVATAFNDQLYTSADSGVSWIARDSVRNWSGVASSADGSTLVALNDGGQIYTSTDFGATWTPRDTNRYWWSVASSADGSALVAGVVDSKIYTSACLPPPTITCPVKKTVECGSGWTFDLPIITGGTATITPASTVTNGVCPKSITQSWLITDAYGNTNTCSQAVIVADSTPPLITGSTNPIIVPLNVNCQLEIPPLHPAASDNCTPASQLTYTQDPPAGAIVSGCQSVTVTVTDLCGHSSHCQIQVCGQDKTAPVIIFPKTVTATNCVVPDVLALVTVSDSCTGTNKLVITQSPPAGTPLAAGGSQVSVTATDPSGNSSTVVIQLVPGVAQSFLNLMFNTAVNSSHAVLPNGAADPHYIVGPVPVGTTTGPGYYNAPTAVIGPFPSLPPFNASKWITLNGSWTQFPNGFYTFTNQFVLPSSANSLTASLSGRWSASTGGQLYLNGSLVPGASIPVPTFGSFWPYWTSFTINSGFLAYPAVNQLAFVVDSPEDYPGVRVEFTDATFNCNACTPPAILQKTSDLSLPLNGTAVFGVTAGGTPPLTYQWYHNGQPLTNSSHFAGVTNASLIVAPVSFADAGIYSVIIFNPCGATNAAAIKLAVTKNPILPWAWWNVAQLAHPLSASVGPDLIFNPTNLPLLSAGTTVDFGLPLLAGKNVNVLYVPPLSNGSYVQLPFVGPAGQNSVSNYTVMMDMYVPTNGSTRSTILTIFDRWGNLLLTANPGVAGETLNLSGLENGNVINLDSTMSLMPGMWNRIALVVNGGSADMGMPGSSGNVVVNSLFINGKLAGGMSLPTASVPFTMASTVTVCSSPSGTTTESFVTSLALFTDSLTPEMLASLGSPDNGPLFASDSLPASMPPALSATMMANGMVNLMWMDSTYTLQETSDLSQDGWKNSMMSFSENADVSGRITLSAHLMPTSAGGKFYRLKYKP